MPFPSNTKPANQESSARYAMGGVQLGVSICRAFFSSLFTPTIQTPAAQEIKVAADTDTDTDTDTEESQSLPTWKPPANR